MSSPVTRELLEGLRRDLSSGKRVRLQLPEVGALSIDRPLPFLLVYRTPDDAPDPGTSRLLSSEASHLIVSGHKRHQRSIRKLVQAVAEEGVEAFGAFLLLEVWAAPVTEDEAEELEVEQRPRFLVRHRSKDDPGKIVDSIEDALARVRLRRLRAEVEAQAAQRCAPPGLAELVTEAQARDWKVTVVGLEVHPVYRSPEGEDAFPLLLRRFHRTVSRALRRALYDFSREYTTHRPAHYHVLGRRAVVKAVWEVDGKLAQVSDRFDFLLQVTPANAQAAWSEFRRRGHAHEPTLHYRHIPVDPALLKRALFQVPVEKVEDPALSLVFRQKQEELDRQITMLSDRNTARFLHGSLALYGPIPDALVALARQLLEALPARSREGSGAARVTATEFAARAQAELEHYRSIWPDVDPRVELRDDIASGLMVSRGRLLVGADTTVPAARVDALLQHEIGTHVLTYYNGAAQPFQQMRSGLAGYEALQEGLAVLAEYLVGGLSRPRLRLLAGRVVAARSLVDGAGFIDTFRLLAGEHGFDRRTAFTTTLRVHRGGGLTKDAVYLQGLVEVLEYLARGGRVRPLFVGKVATDDIPIVRELQLREVLRDPPLMPRYLERPEVQERLERLREGATVFDLTKRSGP